MEHSIGMGLEIFTQKPVTGKGAFYMQYIYNPSIVGEFESSRTVELFSGRDGFILGDYNAAGDLCGIEVIGDVDQETVSKFTIWQK